MILVVGGAYQGKTEYVISKYGLKNDEIIDCENNILSDFHGVKCVNNFHIFVKELFRKGLDPIESAEKIIEENLEIIIIMNEVGNGIVPIDKFERQWREQVGKTGCFLAEKADHVIRIVCGCGTELK